MNSKTSDKEPSSMAELLARQKDTKKRFALGERIEGTVVEKTSKSLILDIGGKSEGLVAERAFNEAKNFIRYVNVGDKLVGKVIVSENPEGFTVLSLREASKDYLWKKLQKLESEGEVIVVTARNVNPSGVVVDIFGLNGFIPASHLGKAMSKNLAKLTGESFKVKIIELDKSSDRVVLSERAVSESDIIKKQKEAFKVIREGDIYKGEITTVVDFGVFVKIEIPQKKEKVELEGLVHISELSWEKVGQPKDIFSVGDKVDVKVIELRDGKLSLSIKQAMGDPWKDVEKKYKPEMKTKGIVVKRSDFGVFVELEPGVEGLIHMTKIPPGKKLREKDKVDVYIEEVNPKEKRISLGLVLTEKPIGYK